MEEKSPLLLWIYIIFLVVYAVVAASGGCSPSKDRFKTSILSSGLTNPTKHGYDFFECGYGDFWVEAFTAHLTHESAEVDTIVKGTVCCGIFKGCTIRWP
jgi:hypothetical protein